MFIAIDENQYRSTNPFIANYAEDELFQRVHSAVLELIIGCTDKMDNELKSRDTNKLMAYLLMSIFENATLVEKDIIQYFKGKKAVADIYPIIAQLNDIAGLGVSLGRIVVHLISSMFLNRNKMGIFWNMLTDPKKLNKTYIPTMHEDSRQALKNVIGGQFYECRNGHSVSHSINRYDY